jgi:hypothetical protein
MTVTISRLYNSYVEARQAINELEAAGVSHDDISVLASNADNWYSEDGTTRGKNGDRGDTIVDRDLDGRDDRAESAGAGAGLGATAGGVAGLLAGLGLIAIPGVGPVVAAGWLVATLAGAATGAATGGILGALSQAGLSREDAEVYAEGLRRGGTVVTARVKDSDAQRLQVIMDQSAVNVGERSAAYRQSGWKSFDPKAPPYTTDEVRRERELYTRR